MENQLIQPQLHVIWFPFCLSVLLNQNVAYLVGIHCNRLTVQQVWEQFGEIMNYSVLSGRQDHVILENVLISFGNKIV